MSEGLKTWKEQMLDELRKYQEKEAVQTEKLIRMSEIEGLLEEGSAMWRFLFEGTDEQDFELKENVKELKEEYRRLKLETEQYNRYYLENNLEKDYFEGLKKQDVAALAEVEKEGFHKAEYALAYLLLCVKNNRKGEEYLSKLANTGDAYAMLRMGEYYEYRAVHEIGKKSCANSIKECKKWYTKAQSADSKMQSECSEGLERIKSVEVKNINHTKKINNSNLCLKIYKALNIAVPVAACFFLVLWALLQVPRYINAGAKYAVDGKIYEDAGGQSQGKIFGIEPVMVDKEMTELIIPDGTKVIPKEVYKDCTKLKSVVIPEGVVKIEEGAFSGCESLVDITFPSTLKAVENEAFSNCVSLKEIQAGNTALGKMASKAFYGCTKLKKVSLPVSCTPAEDSFLGCSNKLEITY